MKHLRQYIRQILLTEGMKTADDLPSDIVIVIQSEPGYMEAYYAMAADPSVIADQFNASAFGSITIYPTAESREGQCGDAWMVGGSSAYSGWGPLLYDVAIEWATQNGGGLISDRESVSDAAREVWDFYRYRRQQDVNHVQLDNLEDSFENGPQDDCSQSTAEEEMEGETGPDGYETSAWVNSALSKAYKKPPTTINALKAAGKLVML